MKKKKSKNVLPKTYPVPVWMDEDLKLTAQNLDVLARHTLAEKLERQAEQLREMKPPPIKPDTIVTLHLRPNMKKALLLFAKSHGIDENYNEQTKLELGARWFLEGALPLISLVSKLTNNRVSYREAEGIEDSVYTEKLIADALNDFEQER